MAVGRNAILCQVVAIAYPVVQKNERCHGEDAYYTQKIAATQAAKLRNKVLLMLKNSLWKMKNNYDTETEFLYFRPHKAQLATL